MSPRCWGYLNIIWLLLKPFQIKDWSYKNLLTFIYLTSAPAILYAIPVERFLDVNTSSAINAYFLLAVAVWRVALLIFYLRRFACITRYQTTVATLLPLTVTVIVSSLSALNLERAVFNIMGGIREKTSNDSALKILYLLMVALISQFTFAAFPEDCIPKNELSIEDEELGHRYVDNIVGVNLLFGPQKYMLSRKGEFGKLGMKLKLSSTLKDVSTQHQIYSSLLFEGLGLIDGGSNTLEGYISSVYVMDLVQGRVLSDLFKCANHEDGYYQNAKDLLYYCEWHCSKNKIHKLDIDSKKFVEVNGNKLCKNISAFKKITFNKASLKRKKDPSGKEYKTSVFPIKVCK